MKISIFLSQGSGAASADPSPTRSEELTPLADVRAMAISSTLNPKFDEEFSKEARKTGGPVKDTDATQKPAEEKAFWFLTLMSHMPNMNT